MKSKINGEFYTRLKHLTDVIWSESHYNLTGQVTYSKKFCVSELNEQQTLTYLFIINSAIIVTPGSCQHHVDLYLTHLKL